MGSETFALFRDLLYLSAGMIGAGLGCILSLFRKDLSFQCRNRMVSLIFCIFSGAAMGITAAAITGPGDFSRFSALLLPLLPPLALVALIFLAVCRFPRAGFLLILPLGLCVVWLGYSFLRFPRIGPEGKALALVGSRGAGTYSLSLDLRPNPRRTGVVYREFPGGSLELEGVYVFFDERFPLIGGEGRGLIREVRRDGETIFSGPLGEASLLGAYYARFPPPEEGKTAGIFLRRFHTTLNLAPLPPGGVTGVILGAGALSSLPGYAGGLSPPGAW
ncbi:MAG: hypothetical protein LBG25_04155 [Spirochaetaceae bacterium]|jgi:hypothetical protein|nr:hypothetical protein [Spirochaetaceae bacterium]